MTEESKLAEKMQDTVKFTEEELKNLKDIQGKYASMQIKFGQIGFAKMRIENEISRIKTADEEVKNEFLEVQTEEAEFIKEITKKYGEGMLDPTTGTFNLSKNK